MLVIPAVSVSGDTSTYVPTGVIFHLVVAYIVGTAPAE